MKLWDRMLRFDSLVEQRYPAIGRVIDVDGVAVHVVEAGPHGAPPIVLVHGASGNVRDFQLSIMPRLAERHHVIALDRPGFGHSDVLPDHGWRLADQVAILHRAVAAMGHGRYLLGGHSYGGSLVMRWALRHPGEVAGILALSAPVMDWGGGGLGLHYEIGGRPVIGPALAHAARLLAGADWVRGAVRGGLRSGPRAARLSGGCGRRTGAPPHDLPGEFEDDAATPRGDHGPASPV